LAGCRPGCLEAHPCLIKDASRNPYSGIGKPEPLRYAFSGYWSRRITGEHRMVYKIESGDLLIAQLRYHY